MRIIGHGVDLVECDRIAALLQRHGTRFIRRILTEREEAYVTGKRNRVLHIAGRFAAKEAIFKVLGTGWRGEITWRDIEITNDAAGQPMVTLSGQCERIARQLGISRILVSITHTRRFAVASAIGIGE